MINILRDVSLELVNGETVCIIGLNGSGKSTLGKAVMNMLPYRDGDILFEGRSVAGLATPDLARIGMAFMLQGGAGIQKPFSPGEPSTGISKTKR